MTRTEIKWIETTPYVEGTGAKKGQRVLTSELKPGLEIICGSLFGRVRARVSDDLTYAEAVVGDLILFLEVSPEAPYVTCSHSTTKKALVELGRMMAAPHKP